MKNGCGEYKFLSILHVSQSGHFVDMSRCGRLVNQVAIWLGTQVFWVESVFREKGERLINEIKSLD
jgi:hypothetical protein